jgi:hypothetical protein
MPESCTQNRKDVKGCARLHVDKRVCNDLGMAQTEIHLELPNRPNPGDWLDTYAAARMIGVNPSTVMRFRPETLRTYRVGQTRIRLYWRADVVALAAARRLVRGDAAPLPEPRHMGLSDLTPMCDPGHTYTGELVFVWADVTCGICRDAGAGHDA